MGKDRIVVHFLWHSWEVTRPDVLWKLHAGLCSFRDASSFYFPCFLVPNLILGLAVPYQNFVLYWAFKFSDAVECSSGSWGCSLFQVWPFFLAPVHTNPMSSVQMQKLVLLRAPDPPAYFRIWPGLVYPSLCTSPFVGSLTYAWYPFLHPFCAQMQ